jgi:hypothetical protein
MLPSTVERVPVNTADEINEQIRRQTEENVARCAAEGSRSIARRLEELDQEWDIERTLETMAPSITLVGMCLGLTVDKRWFILPLAVQAFFLQHALQGWCPPIPVLRRLGVRTAGEIDAERHALKALRGDYEDLPGRIRQRDGARRAVQAAAH